MACAGARAKPEKPVSAAPDPVILNALDFGVLADGKTDDGPAVLKMMENARELAGAPVTLAFPKDKIIHAATADESRYLFQLRKTSDITIDGGGSTFVCHPHIRMVDLDHAVRPVIRNFNVDYTPHPFIETVIEAVDPARRFVDVKPLQPDELDALGGPTKEDGEQAFIGFAWCENGPHPKAARHFSVAGAEKLSGGRARIFFDGEAFSQKQMADHIVPGATRFSVPRPGVAHRRGPGALFQIHDTVDARIENIHVWGSPWFTFSVYRNEGELSFIDADVVPRPGTNRLMAGGRDAFHVTGNRATMLFDGCDTAGLGDDDYNFCVLSSIIRKVISPTEILIRQKFPIQYNPMRVGETLIVMNNENIVIGSAVIAGYHEEPLKDSVPIVNGGRCPAVKVTLEIPIAGLKNGLTVWSKEAGNPDTIMRNCTANFGCRMQTSLTIEDCEFTCYNVSYGMNPKHPNVEGPGPGFMIIRNTTFNTGRGSGYKASCQGKGPIGKTRIQDITIENCTFNAPLTILKARRVTLKNNRFHDEILIGDHEHLEAAGNKQNGKPFSPKPPPKKRTESKL